MEKSMIAMITRALGLGTVLFGRHRRDTGDDVCIWRVQARDGTLVMTKILVGVVFGAVVLIATIASAAPPNDGLDRLVPALKTCFEQMVSIFENESPVVRYDVVEKA
jgi:hypothetical protein